MHSLEVLLLASVVYARLHQVSVDLLVSEVVLEDGPQFGVGEDISEILHVY